MNLTSTWSGYIFVKSVHANDSTHPDWVDAFAGPEIGHYSHLSQSDAEKLE